MFFCIVLSILLFILSAFEMKKVTQPKFRVLDVEIIENELKFNNKNDKYEYAYDTVFKYMDGDNEKYVRGDSCIEYSVGEKIQVYIDNKGRVARKPKPISKMPMAAYALLGISFLIASSLLIVLNNEILFRGDPTVQIGVLLMGALNVVSGLMLYLDYKIQDKHLESDEYRDITARVKLIRIKNYEKDNSAKKVFTTVCEYMRNGIVTNFATPRVSAIPPREGDLAELKQDKETGEIFFRTIDDLPLYVGGIVLIVASFLFLYFSFLVFI